MTDHSELLALRAKLARAEREARKAPPPPPRPPGAKPKPLPPQREAELRGVDTRDHVLSRAHARLREAVLLGHYDIRPHAVQHARAEGFLEHDIVNVLASGRVRAVYPEERRMLVSGTFASGGVRLPLHVVAELHMERGGDFLEVVTAFVPKHPHHIVSRARLAVMLRWDGEEARVRLARPGNKAGYRGKGKWRR